MQQIDSLKSAFTVFQSDFSKFSTDVQAKLAALGANQASADDLQTLTQIQAGLEEMDAQVKALDSSLGA